jgi:hypothetical protein
MIDPKFPFNDLPIFPHKRTRRPVRGFFMLNFHGFNLPDFIVKLMTIDNCLYNYLFFYHL